MWGADDPCDRMPMVWDDMPYEDQAGRSAGPAPAERSGCLRRRSLHDYYRAAHSACADDSAVLRHGSFEPAGQRRRRHVFCLSPRADLGEESLLVAFNRGDATLSLEDSLWRRRRHPSRCWQLGLRSSTRWSKPRWMMVRRDWSVRGTVPPLGGVVLGKAMHRKPDVIRSEQRSCRRFGVLTRAGAWCLSGCGGATRRRSAGHHAVAPDGAQGSGGAARADRPDSRRTTPSVRIRALYKETEELRSGFQAAALAGAGPNWSTDRRTCWRRFRRWASRPT